MKYLMHLVVFVLISNSGVFSQEKIHSLGYYLLKRDVIVRAKVLHVNGFKLKADIEMDLKRAGYEGGN